MTDGSLVTISSVLLAIVSVSALAATAVRSWRDAAGRRTERNGARETEARLRSQVYLLEVRIAALTDELEALRSGRAADALGAPAQPGGHPPGQVAPGEAERLGHPGPRRDRVADATNLVLFPGPSKRRARR
jgi:hypothetical protein